MARIAQTYQLLVAQHRIGRCQGNGPGESTVVFRGINGQLSPELFKQGLVPEFFTRGGGVKPLPEEFADAVKAVTAGVSCVSCRHCHGLVEKPRRERVGAIGSGFDRVVMPE